MEYRKIGSSLTGMMNKMFFMRTHAIKMNSGAVEQQYRSIAVLNFDEIDFENSNVIMFADALKYALVKHSLTDKFVSLVNDSTKSSETGKKKLFALLDIIVKRECTTEEFLDSDMSKEDIQTNCNNLSKVKGDCGVPDFL